MYTLKAYDWISLSALCLWCNSTIIRHHYVTVCQECPDGQKYDEQKSAGPKLRPGVVKFQGRGKFNRTQEESSLSKVRWNELGT